MGAYLSSALGFFQKRPWVAYGLLALFGCLPIVVVRHPPLQDMPFHLAAIRVIHSFHDPAYGFDDDFVLALGRTQYVLYYLLASALAYLIGIVAANLLLVAAYLGGSVLAMRELLRALGKDERLCLFVPPLLINVMFLFGLLPYLFGIPLMLLGIAFAVRYHDRPTLAGGLVVAAIGALLFYVHVFPLALFALGFAAAFPWQKPRAWLVAALPSLPPVLLVGWFSFFTPEGKLARGALLHPETPSPLGPLEKLKDAYNWLGDVFQDMSDEAIYGTLVALAIAATVIGFRARAQSSAARRFALVPLACVLMVFIGGEQHGHIWLIWQRFPMLFALTAIPLLRFPTGNKGVVVAAMAAMLSIASTINTAIHFIAFQRNDVDGFDHLIDTMEPRKHVAGLIFDKWTKQTWRHPLVHFVSYYQLEKGGVVEFTFAGYPHWPFQFQPGKCPTSGCPARINWEWSPEKVPVREELYPYFDYVLTRGDGFEPPDGTYRLKTREGKWAVWERL